MASAPASWTVLRSFMQSSCGVVLGEDQHYLMEARLAPVAKVLNYGTVEEYVAEACRAGAPRSMTSPLIDAMTTHETSFFRDGPFWRTFQETVLPALGVLDPAHQRPVKVWSAACSTGQEAYSLAMLLEEQFPALAARTQIVATDVSEGVVEQAARGTFSVFEVNRGVSAPRLLRHFERDGGNFRVKEKYRRRITWQQQNLISGWPPWEGLDVALVRNVLIYFPEATRALVLKKVRAAVRPSGFLGVGSTELLPGTPTSPGWYPAREAGR
jgi:chemotaxis protein methyltransferase CheR